LIGIKQFGCLKKDTISGIRLVETVKNTIPENRSGSKTVYTAFFDLGLLFNTKSN
jgi:hypothetical protein